MYIFILIYIYIYISAGLRIIPSSYVNTHPTLQHQTPTISTYNLTKKKKLPTTFQHNVNKPSNKPNFPKEPKPFTKKSNCINTNYP